MDVFKISSSDITNKPFIELICSYGKPLILSTGGSYVDEIQDAVHWIDGKSVPVALLHCVLNYPTDDAAANLGMIMGLKRKFPDRLIGYSDHTLPDDMKNLELAFLLGAEIIEKHFTHDKSLPGNDHYHSMDKKDLDRFFSNIKRVELLFGSDEKSSLPSEEPARLHARRSLVALCDIPEGKKISEEVITWKRPGHGISPRDIEAVIGKLASQDIRKDEILQWEMLV
jgi:N-acetylneuraminate synthase